MPSSRVSSSSCPGFAANGIQPGITYYLLPKVRYEYDQRLLAGTGLHERFKRAADGVDGGFDAKKPPRSAAGQNERPVSQVYFAFSPARLRLGLAPAMVLQWAASTAHRAQRKRRHASLHQSSHISIESILFGPYEYPEVAGDACSNGRHAWAQAPTLPSNCQRHCCPCCEGSLER